MCWDFLSQFRLINSSIHHKIIIRRFIDSQNNYLWQFDSLLSGHLSLNGVYWTWTGLVLTVSHQGGKHKPTLFLQQMHTIIRVVLQVVSAVCVGVGPVRIWERSLSSGCWFDFVCRRWLQRINIESRRVEFPDKRLLATLAIHHKSVETW